MVSREQFAGGRYRSSSEEEELVGELDARLRVQELTRQEGQFVGVLAGSGNSDGARPVPLHVDRSRQPHPDGTGHLIEDGDELLRLLCTAARLIERSLQISLDQETSEPQVKELDCRQMVSMGRTLALA
ncbi:hypothetical protein F7725_012382 [Dissostichus mawsoni]|uniref:Uncharacterized protein n=1 Tax=Dissostichus mawsoni TaxID=36200 RepID=A0A7J5YMM1_DISMA|nr:hypothetical protein F7725_012382 [Dissostichus mawsoni]